MTQQDDTRTEFAFERTPNDRKQCYDANRVRIVATQIKPKSVSNMKINMKQKYESKTLNNKDKNVINMDNYR